jgi:hypothetical protein
VKSNPDVIVAPAAMLGKLQEAAAIFVTVFTAPPDTRAIL